jgi:hypothetical protein
VSRSPTDCAGFNSSGSMPSAAITLGSVCALLELFQPGEAFAHPSLDPALQQFVASPHLSGIRSAFVRSVPLLHVPALFPFDERQCD